MSDCDDIYKKTGGVMTDQEARDSLTRFMNGLTDVREELCLYEYFARKEIATDLLPYRKLMEWFAAGCDEIPIRHTSKKYLRRMKLHFRISAAAIAALILASSVSVIAGQARLHDILRTYEGSFTMVEGERVTNLREVLVDMEMAVRTIDSDEVWTEQWLTEMNECDTLWPSEITTCSY